MERVYSFTPVTTGKISVHTGRMRGRMGMNTIRRKLYCGVIIVIFLIFGGDILAQTYYSQSSGDVNSTANWNSEAGGGGSAPADFTGTNSWIIQSGHSMTMSGSWVVGAGGAATVTIEGGLTLSSTYLVTITGTLAVNGTLTNAGTYTSSAAVTASAGITVTGTYDHALNGGYLPTVTWSAGSTCQVSGWTSSTSLGNTSFSQAFYNFTWDCTGQAANVSFGGRASSIAGTFTMKNTNGYYVTPGGTVTYENYVQTGGVFQITYNILPRTLNITQDFSLSGGTFSVSAAGVGTLNVGGTMTITGGILDMDSSTRSGAVYLFGDLVHTSGTITADNEQYGEIYFAGAYDGTTGIQLFTSGGSIENLVYIMVIEGAYLQMASESTILAGALAAFILDSGATLGITSAEGISADGATGSIQTPVNDFNAGANYVYCGTTNQITGTGLPSSLTGTLTINNSGSNSVTLDNACTVASGGAVYIAGGTLAAGTNLTMASTSSIYRSGGSMSGTIQGSGVYNVIYGGNSMTTTTELSGTGLNNITVAMAEGEALTADQSVAPDGDLTLTAGILDLGAYTWARSSSGGTLAVADGATLKIGGTNTVPANYAAHTLGTAGTIEYSGADQSVAVEAYGNLVLSGSGTKTLAGSTVVSSALTNSAGVTLDVDLNQLTTADLSNDGSIIITSAALNQNGSMIASGTISQGTSSSVTYERQLNTEAAYGDYHYFSSPVLSNTAANSSKVTEVWQWDEPAGDWSTLSITGLSGGRGYNLDQTSSSDGLITFTGTLASSDIVVDASSPYADVVTGTEDYRERTLASGRDTIDNWGGGGWNMLGNPYTSAFLVSDFLSANDGNFDPNYQAVYLYAGGEGEHGVYYYIGNSTGWGSGLSQTHVQAGQGFFVIAMNDYSTFTFTRSMQEHSYSDAMLKSTQTETESRWPGLQLKVRQVENENMTTIVFNDEMTAGLDPGYDIGLYSAGADVEIYTALLEDNGINFACQALPISGCDTVAIPVGIDSQCGGEITFSANVERLSTYKYLLEDRATGMFTDISNNSYTATIPSDTYGTGRFFIHTTLKARRTTTEENSSMNLRIWASHGQLIIQGAVSDKAICSVFNVQGRKVAETRLTDGEQNIVTMPENFSGVAVVKVLDGTVETVRKVVFVRAL